MKTRFPSQLFTGYHEQSNLSEVLYCEVLGSADGIWDNSTYC